MKHLIANTGLHFFTEVTTFNPQEPLVLPSGKILRYAFCELPDFMTGSTTFGLLCHHSAAGGYIPVSELRAEDALERVAGNEVLDESGVPQPQQQLAEGLFTVFQDADPSITAINALGTFMLPSPADPRQRVPALSLLLGRWLPMPLFEREVNGETVYGPAGWCRLKVDDLGPADKPAERRYRLTWAVDTTLGADDEQTLRPYFLPGEDGPRTYCLCNKPEQLVDFFGTDPIVRPVAEYLAALLGIDTSRIAEHKTRYLVWYAYFINFLRLHGAGPEVQLYAGVQNPVPVDLVLDVGNSRTCGVLFEQGDFTKAKMLELRDLTHPEATYSGPFDMRFVFRKADIGGALLMDEDLFAWKSFVRVGEEARHLIYRSRQEAAVNELHTNYSSPKRYLWDEEAFEGQWQNLVSVDDPANVAADPFPYIRGLSEQFDPLGRLSDTTQHELTNRYARGSLMTFVLIEIFQQALMQINSVRFRDVHGSIDCRRYLRTVVMTCPPAMPLVEQAKLRRAAADAWRALQHVCPGLPDVRIAPDPDALLAADDYDPTRRREWAYDEATCSQLVYLYAEMAQRYGGETERFFEMKGHVRPELAAEGYDKKALTIGSIDIGAGTTDIMICAYRYDGDGRSRITPVPKFWDSFYLAGDDILRRLVQTFVIEGDAHESPRMGCVKSALELRLLALTDDELRALPCLKPTGGLQPAVYRGMVENIVASHDRAERDRKTRVLASTLVHDFFGTDSNMQSVHDRRERNDFNMQVNVPIAQLFMDLQRLHRPSRIYGFDELFPTVKPASYVLDAFAEHFGFRFEELEWRYDPDHVASDIKAVLEPLMKQLSVVLYAYHCDVLVLAGRPTSLDTVTELFIKYYPLSPDRLIRLGEYRVGNWYPFANGLGYFFDQKSVVAVGAMVGHIASTEGFNGMVLDMQQMTRRMRSTANYIGIYTSRTAQVKKSLLTPQASLALIDAQAFPVFLGCKQLDDVTYQARPLYAIYNRSQTNALRIALMRNFHEDREKLHVEEVTDAQGNTLPADAVELREQSLTEDGRYWLDKGEFELSLQ